jgi:hypothetical protein
VPNLLRFANADPVAEEPSGRVRMTGPIGTKSCTKRGSLDFSDN